MDDVADAVKVVESHQRLPGDLSHDGHGDTLEVEALDEGEQVPAKDLEGHDRVTTMHGVMEELIVHLKVMSVSAGHIEVRIPLVLSHRIDPLFIIVVARNVKEDLFLLHRALRVLGGTLLNLESIELLVLQLQGKPHSREVTPTKFLQDDILVINDLTRTMHIIVLSRSK